MLRRRPTSLVALLLTLVAALSLWQPAQAHAAESSPPLLVSLERVSADVVGHGEEVAIAWEFTAAVDYVSVTFRDGLGGTQTVWGPMQGTAMSGIASGTVDTATWPGGSMVFDGLYYGWNSADGWKSVQLDASGNLLWKSEGLGPVPAAGDAVRVSAFDVQSDVDLSIPPSLTSLTRLSADTLRDGDVLEIAWAADRPLDNVRIRFRDLFGGRHYADWIAWQSPSGTASQEGVARVQLQAGSWPGGVSVFDAVEYSWTGGWISINTGGVESRRPSGLGDAALPTGADAVSFTLESDVDPTAVPGLISLERVSPDVVQDGDAVLVRWEFDVPVASVNITVLDSLGRPHSLWKAGGGEAGTTGESRALVDTTDWAAGPVVLKEVSYTWGLGMEMRWVTLNAEGDVLWTSPSGMEVPPARDAIDIPPFDVRSDTDLSVPAALTSTSRLSPAVVADGEAVEIAWTADKPLDRVIFRFKDAIGSAHSVEWSMWSSGFERRTEGVARAELDTARWAGGEAVFDGVDYYWLGGSMSLDADGDVVFRNPSGLKDPVLPNGGFDALAFTVDSDIDLRAVPSVTSVTRESAAVLAGGDELRIAWETDAPVGWLAFQYEDGFGRQQWVTWVGEPATSGVLTAAIDASASAWAPGAAELKQVRYSTPADHTVVLSRDGATFSKWPAGIDDAKPYAPGFAALDFELDSDVVFEAVPVPAPTFVDATCDGPAHLALEDFPHGWWSWGESFGDQFDGEPWGMEAGKPYAVTAMFEDGWGTSGQSQWYFTSTEPGSCEPELELTSAPVPVVRGDPSVGSTLVVDAGAWEPAPVELSYQWFRDGLPVPAAQGYRYELTAADAGTTVTVEVTGTKAGYRTTARMSEPVEVQQPSIRDIPSVVHDALDELGPRRLVVRTEPGIIGRTISQAIAASTGKSPSDAEVDVFAASAQYSAEHYSPGVEVVYVTSGVGLRAAPTVDALDGPLLLVTPSSIPAVVEAELDRLQPQRIVVLDAAHGIGRPVVKALEGYLR